MLFYLSARQTQTGPQVIVVSENMWTRHDRSPHDIFVWETELPGFPYGPRVCK